MRFIAIFASAVFYCAATAMASQPDKVLLREIARNHTKDSHVPLKIGAGKATVNGTKTEHIKIKNDAHRNLAQEDSIRGGKNIDSVQRSERSLHDFKKNAAFAANVAMPIQLQGKLGKTVGGSSRHLQQDIPCVELDDGTFACCTDDYSNSGLTLCLNCPSSAVEPNDCSYCQMGNDSYDLCNSCSLCTSAVDAAAYDCSNLAEGECSKKDCNGCTGPEVDDPSRPPRPTSGAWNPKSAAPMTILFVSATAIAAHGLF